MNPVKIPMKLEDVETNITLDAMANFMSSIIQGEVKLISEQAFQGTNTYLIYWNGDRYRLITYLSEIQSIYKL